VGKLEVTSVARDRICSPSLKRLYKLRVSVREMNTSGDLYSRVPGWVNPEDLLEYNRQNDPEILRKVQRRQEQQQQQQQLQEQQQRQ
jgi:hypothetical protein